jgi:type IV pilus assembly protein PilC
MLIKIADFYEDQVTAMVAGLTSLIEPLLIVGLGLVVGFIVISMFLPMFKMIELVSQ